MQAGQTLRCLVGQISDGKPEISDRRHRCQIPELLDSRVVDLLCLPGKTVRHFHPNRQAKLAHCRRYGVCCADRAAVCRCGRGRCTIVAKLTRSAHCRHSQVEQCRSAASPERPYGHSRSILAGAASAERTSLAFASGANDPDDKAARKSTKSTSHLKFTCNPVHVGWHQQRSHIFRSGICRSTVVGTSERKKAGSAPCLQEGRTSSQNSARIMREPRIHRSGTARQGPDAVPVWPRSPPRCSMSRYRTPGKRQCQQQTCNLRAQD